jgi:hypothetical protein
MDDPETLIVTQPDSAEFKVAHRGALGVHGIEKADPVQLRVGGEMVHSSTSERPLVHMVLWDEDCACEVNGRITVVGDSDAPAYAVVRHRFETDHHQTHAVKTDLADPIHHALQMRTPLQLRFCNRWNIASDYTVEVNVGTRQLLSLRLTGATVASPQPCEDERPCYPPSVSQPVHP